MYKWNNVVECKSFIACFEFVSVAIKPVVREQLNFVKKKLIKIKISGIL